MERALEHDRAAMISLIYPRRALFARDELAEFRLDGAQVLRDFEASGRTYREPAVLVLDYTVVRVFEDGSRLVLTHNIWKMQSEEAVDEHGEFEPPGNAYLFRLHTVKADGTRLEPDMIEGKDTISMPNLQIGDYVEHEFVQYVPPSSAYAAGLVGGRFMFQGFEKPYDRSELVVAVPTSMGPLVVDPRGPAPEVVRETRGPLEVYRWRVNESRPLVEQLPLPPREPSKRGDGPTLRERILDALKVHAGEVLTTARVTELLRARRADKVRSTLQRMAVQRTIEKVGLGQWRAAGAPGPASRGET